MFDNDDAIKGAMLITMLLSVIAIFILVLFLPADPIMVKSWSKQECSYVILSDGEKASCDVIQDSDTYELVWGE